ncbi:hypothetical protein MML48_7g00003693 [Holotrichia oblita]|uniref:Uncharacterized protein n=1 Tax=Holotrichia oblita TaxID=644536 RepID=A0ACB9SQP1_HOLOL|nr:hypothetical protein MML48_7g00003693 [Holotrichia oblita]
MASPSKALNENFAYNSMLARALVQLIPAQERDTVRVWFNKLHVMDRSAEDMKRRNEYMWFLLLMLQNKRLQPPFNKGPPGGELRPLNEILSPDIYEEVLMSSDDQSATWLENTCNADQTCKDAYTSEDQHFPSTHPAQFLTNQPLPQNGIICYVAAFSDHD